MIKSIIRGSVIALILFIAAPGALAQAWPNQIMLDLLNGPLSVANVQAFLTQAEAVIGSALANDPFPTTDGSPADEFNRLRTWVAARDVNVRTQLATDGPPSPRP